MKLDILSLGKDSETAAAITFCHLFCLRLTVFGPQLACSVVIAAIFLGYTVFTNPGKCLHKYDMQGLISSRYSEDRAYASMVHHDAESEAEILTSGEIFTRHLVFFQTLETVPYVRP